MIKLTPALLRSVDYKEHVNPSIWATKNFILEKESAVGGGAYSYEYAPHAKKPLEYLGDDSITEVTLLFASQTGKTTIGMVYLNYFLDIVGGNIMFFLPDEKLIPFTATDRILPSIMRTKNAQSVTIEKEERKTRDNTRNIRYSSGVIRILSSTNASNRKSTPAKCIILDEISEMKISHVKEITERAKTYEMYGMKILKTSTIMYENDPIILAYDASELKYKYFVKCPICGKSHEDDILTNLVYPSVDEFDMPKDLSEDKQVLIYASLASKQARYKCPHCNALWDTKTKNQAVKLGNWEKVGLEIENPKSVGFKTSSFISLFVSIEKMTYEYLSADTDDKKAIFYRGWLSKIYEPIIKTRPKDEIKKLSNALPPRELPKNCLGLVASIDVQKDHFYFMVVAVDENINAHVIDYGRIESWADLHNFICFNNYNEVYPETIVIDSGAFTSDVYNFCIEINKLLYTDEGKSVYAYRQGQLINLIPLKGNRNNTSMSSKEKYSITKIEKDPSTGRAYQDSLSLHYINTYFYKDTASLYIEKGINNSEHYRLYIHNQIRDDICTSLVSEVKTEYKNSTGNIVYRYETTQSHAFNHYWDCLVYNLYLIDLLGFIFREKSQASEENLTYDTLKQKTIDYLDEF